MVRPSNSLLGSSRAAQRASLRAERARSLVRMSRGISGLFSGIFGNLMALALLWATPLAYLCASYFAVDLPARVVAHRVAWGWTGVLVFLASAIVSAIGISRALRNAEPIAPVRPQFAKAMLALSWVAGILFTIGDLAG